jgi:hypothetical protein
MKEYSDPLDHLINCCEREVDTGYCTLTKFNILNAKDELKKLRKQIDDLQMKNIAWASINNRGDFYNLTLYYNKFQDENTLVPLYCNLKEFKEKYGNLSKQTL